MIEQETTPRLLIVDDTPANLNLLEEILSKENYAVRALPSGKLALRAAFAKPPDLILLDIKMPNMDGYEVCTQLKADERTRDIPILFISALQEVDDKVRAFEVGGVDYISKPFQVEEVLARVRTHLQMRTLQQKLSTAKQQAENANHIKSVFLASVSNELRDPLNSIIGFAQVLASAEQLPADLRPPTQHIQSSGEHLLTLINNVLDLSKIESGEMEIVLDTVDVNALVQEITTIFAWQAEQKSLALSCHTSLQTYLYADPKRLRQVLLNLLSNAIKFTATGHVSVYADYQDGYLNLCVEDSGQGISTEQQQEIFKPFTQLNVDPYKNQGIGLGLSITRKIITHMNGDIGLNSDLGKGCRFQVKIPLEPANIPYSKGIEKLAVGDMQAISVINNYPLVWLAALEQAVSLGESEQITDLLAHYDNEEMTQLQAWANQYAYQRILKWIAQAHLNAEHSR